MLSDSRSVIDSAPVRLRFLLNELVYNKTVQLKNLNENSKQLVTWKFCQVV